MSETAIAIRETAPAVLTTAFAPTTPGMVEYYATSMAESTCVPRNFQGNFGNCMIALDYALRLRISPLAVMQEMYIVHDRPSFSGKFMSAVVHRSGEFTRIKYEFTGTGTSRSCTAWFEEKATGDVIKGTPITWDMVKSEGWAKNAKWNNMADQMFKYRASAFLVRSTCPDLILGMVTHEEAEDIHRTEKGYIDADEPKALATEYEVSTEYTAMAKDALESLKSAETLSEFDTIASVCRDLWAEVCGDDSIPFSCATVKYETENARPRLAYLDAVGNAELYSTMRETETPLEMKPLLDMAKAMWTEHVGQAKFSDQTALGHAERAAKG